MTQSWHLLLQLHARQLIKNYEIYFSTQHKSLERTCQIYSQASFKWTVATQIWHECRLLMTLFNDFCYSVFVSNKVLTAK